MFETAPALHASPTGGAPHPVTVLGTGMLGAAVTGALLTAGCRRCGTALSTRPSP